MKEVQSILQDPLGGDPHKGESKIKKYMRIIFCCVGLAFFALVIGMAILRRYGG